MKQYFFILIISILIGLKASAQQGNDSSGVFLKTGYGYFNDEFMLTGRVLWSEIGFIQGSGYSFSLNYKLGETVNDRAEYFGGYDAIQSFRLNYIYNVATLYMGYHFISKNEKHVIHPKLGPYFSMQRIVYPTFNEAQDPVITTPSHKYIGFALGLDYQYHLNKHFSVGMLGDFSLAYQYGVQYLTISPFISLQF